jgi:hypothetical protein
MHFSCNLCAPNKSKPRSLAFFKEIQMAGRVGGFVVNVKLRFLLLRCIGSLVGMTWLWRLLARSLSLSLFNLRCACQNAEVETFSLFAYCL